MVLVENQGTFNCLKYRLRGSIVETQAESSTRLSNDLVPLQIHATRSRVKKTAGNNKVISWLLLQETQ